MNVKNKTENAWEVVKKWMLDIATVCVTIVVITISFLLYSVIKLNTELTSANENKDALNELTYQRTELKESVELNAQKAEEYRTKAFQLDEVNIVSNNDVNIIEHQIRCFSNLREEWDCYTEPVYSLYPPKNSPLQ